MAQSHRVRDNMITYTTITWHDMIYYTTPNHTTPRFQAAPFPRHSANLPGMLTSLVLLLIDDHIICMYVFTYTCVYIYIYTHTYIHTYTYIQTHTHIPRTSAPSGAARRSPASWRERRD